MLKKNLKQLRKNHHLTQDAFAKLISVKRHTVGDWETGRSEPSIENLKQISKAFQISIQELLGLTIKICSSISFEEQKKYIKFKASTSLEQDILQKVQNLSQKQLLALYQLLTS